MITFIELSTIPILLLLSINCHNNPTSTVLIICCFCLSSIPCPFFNNETPIFRWEPPFPHSRFGGMLIKVLCPPLVKSWIYLTQTQAIIPTLLRAWVLNSDQRRTWGRVAFWQYHLEDTVISSCHSGSYAAHPVQILLDYTEINQESVSIVCHP